MPDPFELSNSLLTLFEAAQSEAKRASASSVSLEHLILVLARKESDRFDSVFGPDAADAFRTGKMRFLATDEDDALAFLVEANQLDVSRSKLLEMLADAGTVASAEADDAANALKHQTASTEQPGSEPALGMSTEDDRSADAGSSDLQKLFPRTASYVEIIAPGQPINGRDDVVDQILGSIARSAPQSVLVCASEGSGRTSVLSALADRLAVDGFTGALAGAVVVRVIPETLILADTAAMMRQVLADAGRAGCPVVLAVDDLEVLAGFGATGRMDGNVLRVLRAGIGLATVPLVLIVDDVFVGRLAGYDDELMRELNQVRLSPLAREVLEDIAAHEASRLGAYHQVTVSADAARLALAPAGRHDTRAHPGLAIDRLDGACARAALRPDRAVSDADLALGDDPTIVPADPIGLSASLRERVVGQDHAVEQLSRHLALTRAQLDLRPERPDGVFLFVGPTGVGKTELARASAHALYGDERQMIRLDMSEYAGEWAISQLIGPPPGYVGSSDPENWLTTRVRNQPDAVLLLDEIEKAHPRVWNTFLQVFDAGHLTDSQGRVADFSKILVILTSNLGSDAFSAPQVGFGRDRPENVEHARVLEQVKATMAPELVNRLDDIIVFRPLAPVAIKAIANLELERVVARLSERGYRITYDDAVVDLLARAGYSPAYGARHLHRNIERLFLQPLAAAPGTRDLSATVVDDAIVW